MKAKATSKIIHLYAMDTNPHIDSIRAMIESRKNLSSKYQLVDLDIQEENFTQAINQLTNIENNNTLNAEQLAEHENLVDYVNFRKDLQSEGLNYMQLNRNQLVSLRGIATADAGRSASYAQNILCFGYGECDWGNAAPQERLKNTYPKRIYDFKTVPAIAQNTSNENVSINPNPTKGEIKVVISGRDNYEQLQFHIKNIRGQEVFNRAITSNQSQFNIAALGQGVFVYEIIHKGERIAIGKLVIQ